MQKIKVFLLKWCNYFLEFEARFFGKNNLTIF